MDFRAIRSAVQYIKPEMFSDPRHKAIMIAIYDLYQQKTKIDILTVTQKLRKENMLDFVGGAYYITSITNKVASAANIEPHIFIVIENWLRTEFGKITEKAYRQSLSKTGDVIELIETTANEIKLLHNTVIRPTQSMEDIAMEMEKEKAAQFLPSPWTALNNIIGGFIYGEVAIIGGRPGMGKEQPLSAKVLTPTGWTTMGKIKPNDNIIGSDGKTYQVINHFPQGVKSVYKVTFDDGSSTECGLEHLWEVSDRKSRKELHTKHIKRVISLKQIIEEGIIIEKTRKNFAVKYVKPVEFVSNEITVDPWLLGIYLAEGNCNGSCISISNPEKEIEEKLKNVLYKTDYLKPLSKYKDEGWRINGQCFYSFLKENNLSTLRSHEKFIPKQYMYSSVENRIKLLQGLMDGDGYVATSNCIEYSTTSKQLKNDVIEIVQSLGGKVSYTERMGRYKKNDKYIETRVNYRIYISFNNDICILSTQKHLSKYKNKKQFHSKFITSIDYIGEKECKCILVNSPDNCYITDDYIVTHNSAMLGNQLYHSSQILEVPSAMFSVEMKTVVLMQRIIAPVVNINSQDIIYNRISSEQRKLIGQAIRNLKKTLYITDNLVMVEDIVAAMYNYAFNYGVKVFYFDYIQRIGCREKYGNRDLQLGYISALLANTLKELNAVGIEGAQLKRAEGAKATSLPTMDDLRESGNFEQDASIILFPFRPIYAGLKEDNFNNRYTDIDVILRIAKSRNGKTSRVPLFYKDIHTLFYEDKQQQLSLDETSLDEPTF